MDTKFLLPLENLEKYKIPDFSEEELNTLNNYIQLTDALIEQQQLFDMFLFNFHNMLNYYEMYHNDTMIRKHNLEDSDFICVNALVTNFISSGNSLIESLQRIAKKEPLEKIFKFEKYRQEEVFGKIFSYKFLYEMRNFSQHGHVPISFSNGIYSFDIYQILTTKNYNIKTTTKENLQEIYQKGITNIVVTLTLVEYNYQIIKMYKKYLELIKPLLRKKGEEIKLLTEKYKSYLIKDEFFTEEALLFTCQDDEYVHKHAIIPSNDPIILLNNNIKKVSKIYIKEREEREKMFSVLKMRFKDLPQRENNKNRNNSGSYFEIVSPLSEIQIEKIDTDYIEKHFKLIKPIFTDNSEENIKKRKTRKN